MDNKYLITVSNIKAVRPLSEGIPQERIDPFILEAQFHDIKPILGDVMYNDFMLNFDNVDAAYDKYRDLLNGKTYTYETRDYRFEGLVPAVVYFSLARFYTEQPINIVRFGLVQKTNDQSQPVSQQTITNAISSLRSMAVNYQNDAIKLIERNISDFPLYGESCNKPLSSSGINFF